MGTAVTIQSPEVSRPMRAMAKRTNPVARGLVVVLAGVLLVGSGLLFVRLRPYWIAKYRGQFANLRGAVLPGAPLAKARLYGAHLQHAVLTGASLEQANLSDVDFSEAKLDRARLGHAT